MSQDNPSSEYLVWGRIERLPGDKFRAIAALSPDLPGSSPAPDDMRAANHNSLEESRIALGRLTYELAAVAMQRGGTVTWLDVH